MITAELRHEEPGADSEEDERHGEGRTVQRHIDRPDQYALAIYLARGTRRLTLRNVGWAFALAGIVVLLVRRVVGNWAADTLSSPSYKGTVHDIWLIGTAILGQIGTAALLYGLATVVAASLAGPTGAARKLRSWTAPTLNEQPGTVAAAVAGLYVLLIFWGPTHALRMWWGILLFAALIAAGLYALRRQTLVEFTHAEPTPGPTPVPTGATTSTTSATLDQIAHLATLHDSGALSDEEYTRAKDLVLSA